MNCLWILLLLFCCNGSNRWGDDGDYDCDADGRRERRGSRRCGSGSPRALFSPDCDRDRDRERDRDRDCDCRASEMEQEDCED